MKAHLRKSLNEHLKFKQSDLYHIVCNDVLLHEMAVTDRVDVQWLCSMLIISYQGQIQESGLGAANPHPL